MKTASPCLAGLAALTLALAVVAAPDEPAPVPPPPPKLPTIDPTSPYAYSAIWDVLGANCDEVPATGVELVRALGKLGDIVQLPVPFSAVALHSGLTHPRVIYTLRPSTTPPPKKVFVPAKQGTAPPSRVGGWSGPSGNTILVPQPPEPLNKHAPTLAQLQGRLFLAANMELDASGESRVRTVEFISWNSRALKFDFGVIEGLGTQTPELKMLDGVRCFSCHKNRGPILGIAPWSNTAHNALVKKTVTEMTGGRAELHLGDADGPEVDAAVRIGGDLLRDRAIFRALITAPNGNQALVLLFDAILTRGSLEKNDKSAVARLDVMPLPRFTGNATQVKINSPTSELRDFSPAGSLTREVVAVVAGGLVKNQVARYDDARAQGRSRLTSEYQPSNPKAFAVVPARAAQTPSELVSAVRLAQTIGLSEKDRELLADALDETVKRLNNPALTRQTVATAVLTGPAFADVMKTGVLPDRDDFKDRFVAGIVEVFRGQKRPDEFWLPREKYARAPKVDPNAKVEPVIATLPSHACAACHDTAAGAKSAFSPIPPLAFDPFDATARAEWIKSATRKQKQDALGRLLQRIDKDKDMPPQDSVEAGLYRAKDPKAIIAVKDWLEAELKKVK